MFGAQTRKDTSDLHCQVSVFTLSLNVALKLKLRMKHLSAAKWQYATGLSLQDTSWAHTFGITKKSMGENKLLLYLITRTNISCCIFPFLPVPVLFPALHCLWFLTPISYSHYSSDIFFPICCPLVLSLAFLPFLFVCLFPLFLPFLVLLLLCFSQH